MTFWERLPHLLFLFVIFGIVFILPFYLVFGGGIAKFAIRPLRRCFEGIQLRSEPIQGDVAITYHTYRGILIWCVQEGHAGYATPDEARILLKRLLRFNLTSGMLSYGLLFIPFLAIGNYKSQIRSISGQSDSGGALAGLDQPQRSEDQ